MMVTGDTDLIGQFDGGDGDKKSIEIQLRTRLQHDWATA